MWAAQRKLLVWVCAAAAAFGVPPKYQGGTASLLRRHAADARNGGWSLLLIYDLTDVWLRNAGW